MSGLGETLPAKAPGPLSRCLCEAPLMGLAPRKKVCAPGAAEKEKEGLQRGSRKRARQAQGAAQGPGASQVPVSAEGVGLSVLPAGPAPRNQIQPGQPEYEEGGLWAWGPHWVPVLP